MKAPDKSEIFRLLGYRGAAPDALSERLAEECAALLNAAVRARNTATRFPLSPGESPAFGSLKIESRSLQKHLADCREIYLFAATLGIETDRLLLRLQQESIAKAAVMQAVAAAALEEYCDGAVESLRKTLSPPTAFTPRFSPGYGDFSIAHQADLLRLLDAPRKIGLSVTESGMLIPMKSITAVIGVRRPHAKFPVETSRSNGRSEPTTGVSPDDCGSETSGCVFCGKKDCAFRKTGG